MSLRIALLHVGRLAAQETPDDGLIPKHEAVWRIAVLGFKWERPPTISLSLKRLKLHGLARLGYLLWVKHICIFPELRMILTSYLSGQ